MLGDRDVFEMKPAVPKNASKSVCVFVCFGHYSTIKSEISSSGQPCGTQLRPGTVSGVHLDRTASQTGQPFLCSCQSDWLSEVHLKRGAAAH